MLQQDEPDDFVISTGVAHSVRDLVDTAFAHAGLDPEKHVKLDPAFLRPAEVEHLIGDCSKAPAAARMEAGGGFPRARPDDGGRRHRATDRPVPIACRISRDHTGHGRADRSTISAHAPIAVLPARREASPSSAMKGIILAGGSGTRLHPLTRAVSKQLLPIYNKPMVYYPLSTLMLAGIRDILIITTPHEQDGFRRLLGDGAELGLQIPYAAQPKPEGLAQAFIIGREFVGDDRVALALGDNIFYGAHFSDVPARRGRRARPARPCSATRCATRSATAWSSSTPPGAPSASRRSRPAPASNYAVTGLYFYDNQVLDIAAGLEPVAARRARDHRRQPHLSRTRAAARREAAARHRLARHRHPRVADPGLELHPGDRGAAGPDGRLPRGDRLPHGLHRRRARCSGWPGRWSRAPTASTCLQVLEQEA